VEAWAGPDSFEEALTNEEAVERFEVACQRSVVVAAQKLQIGDAVARLPRLHEMPGLLELTRRAIEEREGLI